MLGGGEVRAILIRTTQASVPLIRRRISSFRSDRTIWKAKLHSTDADDVPTPPSKRGVVRVQEMYLSREGIRGDVTDSDRKKQTVKHGQANNTQRGAKMVFGSTLDGLATRNTAGSGR